MAKYLLALLSLTITACTSESTSTTTPDHSSNPTQEETKNISKSLFDWNNGEGTHLEGWTRSEDVAYGLQGWTLDQTDRQGAGQNYSWGYGPRLFRGDGYGEITAGEIDNTVRAPSTSTGGSLRIYETPESTHHQSSWWLWYDGIPLSERGITDNKTNRMSFYLKIQGMDPLIDDGLPTRYINNVHIGTYLCWPAESGIAYGTGDGCPYEGPGNQHYYHYLTTNPGGWIHVLLDQHPQHRRSQGPVDNNPVLESDGKHYFAQLNQFYLETRYPAENPTQYHVDEIEFFSTENSEVTIQNEESITSLWVGYWPEQDHWEIGFHDESFEHLNDDSQSTFEIRWSTQPISQDNFNSANTITPLFYGGDTHAGAGGEHLIRRFESWGSNVWTRFKLPTQIQAEHSRIYFAVKDVSRAGAHTGSLWPWDKPDAKDAPTEAIKIIDYVLRTEI